MYEMSCHQVRCTILDAWGWYTGTTQRDGVGREEGGGFRMGSMLLNCGIGEDLESPLECREIKASILKEISPEYSLKM